MGYPTDVTDEERAEIAPHLTKAAPTGRPRTVDLRQVFNGLRYKNRTGCQWGLLPEGFPPRWRDELLKLMVLKAVAHHALGETDTALQVLRDVLAMAKPHGFIRLFVDEGPVMAGLLSEAAALGMQPDYIGRLLAAFPRTED